MMMKAKIIASAVLICVLVPVIMTGCISFRPASPDYTESNTGVTTETAEPTEPAKTTDPEPQPTEPAKTTDPEPQPTEPAKTTDPEPQPTEPAKTTDPEPQPTEPAKTTDPDPQPTEPKYVIVPAGERVDESYFSEGTLFIGDSLTTGLPLYHVLDSSFYCVESISTYNILTLPFIERNGTKITLTEALQSDGNKWKRIYIQLGVNEIWSTSASFASGYEKLIDALREYCPDAVIYVQSVFPITAAASSGTYSEYGGNAKLREYNASLIELCERRGLYYVNVYEILDDGTGALKDSYAGSDGVHIPPSTYRLWVDYLFTHTAT